MLKNQSQARKIGAFASIFNLALLALLTAAQPVTANPTLIPGVWTNITPAAAQIGPSYGLNYFTQGITIDPNNPSTLYFCVTGYLAQPEIGGIWKSTDAGSTWTENSTLDAPVHILINPSNSNDLYAVDGVRGATGGFWVSTNAGGTWTEPAGFLNFCNTTVSGFNFQDGYSIAADPSNFNHVLYTSHSGLSDIGESTDGGNTWVAHTTPATLSSGGYGVFFLDVPSLGIGNAQTWMFDSQTDGMYRTTNSGATWTDLTTIASMVHGGNQTFYTNTGILFTGATTGLFESTDNGSTWQQSNFTGGGVIGLVGDGTNLYTGPFNQTGPFSTATYSNPLSWSTYNGQTLIDGPFEMRYDSANGIIYSSNVQAGIWALKVPAPGVPAAPTGLTLTAGNTQATLNWTASSGAASYNVLESTLSSSGYAVAATGITSTTATITGLTNGSVYYFVVAAVNSHGSGIISNETHAVPTTAVPLNRSGWTVSASASAGGAATNAIDGNLNTRWSTGAAQAGGEWFEINMGSQQSFNQMVLDSGSNTGDYPRGYSITLSNDGINWGSPIATGSPTSTPVVINFASQSAQYIKITQTGSTTSWWSEAEINVYTGASGSAPSAPTGLTAAGGNAQVALSWSASSGASTYNVYRGTTAGGESTTAIATGITSTSYINTSLTNGVTYYFTVKAVNSYGTSGASNEVSATPSSGGGGTPIIQIACGGPAVSPFIADTDFTGSSGTYTVTNTINTSGVTNPAPMAVYQSERAGPMTYTIPGLTSGSTYTVRLHFAEIYFTAASARQFNVAINGTPVLTNFDIFATDGAAFKANIQQFTATANVSGQIVIAFTVGTADQPKIDGIEILTSGGGSAPSAPTGLTASGGNAQAVLSWTASSGATSYNVLRSTVNGSGYASVTTGLTTTGYTNTGLTNGTTYYFVVTAVNSSGTSGNSNQATATPSASSSLLSQGQPATASSTQDNSGTYNASNAFDGNTTTTRWGSAFSDPQRLQVDLGATHSITEVKLYWEAAYALTFQIQTSPDATNWTTIYSTTTGVGGNVDLTGLSGSGRYVRMYGTVRGTTYGYSLYEMQVYGN